MTAQNKRQLTLESHYIHEMPIAILMPHGACNCRCIMCDIWKGNATAKRLSEPDIVLLISDLKKLKVEWVAMSGGEALINPDLFLFCELLRNEGIKVSILSTGLLLSRYANDIVNHCDEVIVSLDGPKEVHNAIRRVPDAWKKLNDGVISIKALAPDFPISGRCVIQRANFEEWSCIVDSAKAIGLDSISFLCADVDSEAFNRSETWNSERRLEVHLVKSQLPILKNIIASLIKDYKDDFDSGFIVERPEKLKMFYNYFAAILGDSEFPPVRCNAPWVSTVVEADGEVRPCFFHRSIGNIKKKSLSDILNSTEAISFRKNLDISSDEICKKCVCTLNLSADSSVSG